MAPKRLFTLGLVSLSGAALIGGSIALTSGTSFAADPQQQPPTGSPASGYLGARLEVANGKVVVRDVFPGSPAEKAGLKAGDEIVSLNGQGISSIAQIEQIARSLKPGDKVTLVVNRGGTNQTLTGTVGQPPALQRGPGGPKGGPGGPADRRGPRVPPGLRDVPADQRFDHLRGGTFSFTDKDNKLVTMQTIPGKVTGVDAGNNRFTITGNDGKQATYRVDGTTTYRGAKSLSDLKNDDKVTVTIVQGQNDLAVNVKRLVPPGSRPKLFQPQPGQGGGRPPLAPGRPGQRGANPGQQGGDPGQPGSGQGTR